MTLRTSGRRLLFGGLGVIALAGSAGVANAQPDPTPPVVPSIIDQLLTSTPVFSVNPDDEGGPSAPSDRVGMVCMNLSMQCR